MGHNLGSSHSQKTYHGACGLKRAVQGRGRQLDQVFPVHVSPANTTEKRLLLAGNQSQLVEMSVTANSPQESFHPEDQIPSRYETLGFKPFSNNIIIC